MFCIVIDEDARYFVIPADKVQDWYDLENGVVPDYAIAAGGELANIQFKSYEVVSTLVEKPPEV